MPVPVGKIDDTHKNKTYHVRRHSAESDGGAASMSPAGTAPQAHRDEGDAQKLLGKMDKRRLPDAAAGGEVPGHGRARWMQGMLIAESLSDITVRASPIQRSLSVPLKSHIIAPAAAPKTARSQGSGAS